MYNKICLMVPTYKRVNWLQRFIESAVQKCSSHDNVCFCICVNKKDRSTIDYYLSIPENFPYSIEMIIEDTPQPNLSLYYNSMYNRVIELSGKETVVSMLGDDMVFESKDYDKRVLDEVNKYNGIGVFWCNDAYIAREKLPVNLFVTPKFVEATGKPFMCELFRADMIDVVWGEVGRLTHTCHYLNDVIIHHYHNSSLKEGFDKTFERLIPLQRSANSPASHQNAKVYSAVVAGNLIASGFGNW